MRRAVKWMEKQVQAQTSYVHFRGGIGFPSRAMPKEGAKRELFLHSTLHSSQWHTVSRYSICILCHRIDHLGVGLHNKTGVMTSDRLAKKVISSVDFQVKYRLLLLSPSSARNFFSCT